MSSNPAYIGPGYWAAWHIKSMKADTREKKAETARSISIDVLNFPCNDCNKDAREYVKTHSLLDPINDSDPLSLFNWTVDFHNFVNQKLKKKIGSLTHETAKRMWSEDSICIENCGVDEDDILDKRDSDSEDEDGRESRESVQIVMKGY
mgnify:CR=1 FL=1